MVVLDDEGVVISVRLRRLQMLELQHDIGSYVRRGVLAHTGDNIPARRFIGTKQFLSIHFIPESEAGVI